MLRRHGWVLGIFTALAGAALAVTTTGCDQGRAAAHQQYSGKYPINVTVTTGMVGDLVRNIGGSHVKVEQLMKGSTDPHLYKPDIGAIQLLDKADIIFY